MSLGHRLVGGVASAAQRSRPATWQDDPSAQVDDAIERLFDDVLLRTSDVDAAIDAVAEQLGNQRETVIGVLLATDPLCAKLPDPSAGDVDPAVDRWLLLARVAEAVWRLVGRAQPGRLSSRDAALLRPLAARLRFLVLAEPLRFRGVELHPWAEPVRAPGPQNENDLRVEQAFGSGEQGRLLLVGRAQEARREWLGHLDDYQSHPLLAGARPAELEGELRDVLLARGHTPLVLSTRKLDQRVAPTAEDQAVARELTDRHLLPRFQLVAPAALALHSVGRWGRWGRPLLAGLTLAVFATAVVLAAMRWLPVAAGVAALGYGLVVAGVVVVGQEWATPWLLRMPAAGAVGMLILVSLHPDWWHHAVTLNPFTVPGLVAAALGYLVIEARNHGVGRWACVRRALLVTLVGAAHALVVAVIGLVTVVPSFAEDGDLLADALASPQAYAVVALASAWCLAVGVFSQILWDDRPITARLAHLEWRTGGSR